MRRAVALLMLGCLGATIAAAATKIKTESHPTFDFARLKTWSWNPSAPGDVKVWVTANSKSEPVKRQYEPLLMQVVEEELAKRGLMRASGTPPLRGGPLRRLA